MLRLTEAALCEYAYITDLQQLLDLALDVMQSQPKSEDKRVEMLLAAYLALASLHLDELRTALDNIRRSLK